MSKARSLTESMKEKEVKDINENAQLVISWIEEKLGEPQPKKSFRELIWDGVLLCRLANALKPGCVRKFHRKPKLLMMQIENAGFFLAACKSRFGLPEAALFQPTDVQDESEESGVASLRKILGVLAQLRKDFPGSEPEGESATFDEPDPDNLADTVPEPDPSDLEEPTPEPVVETAVAPAQTVADFGPQPGQAFSHQPSSGSWYISGDFSGHTDTQSVVLPIIKASIDHDLSFESKKNLLSELRTEALAIRKKLAAASNEELRVLAHQYGLGNTLDEVPANKERKWYIEWILKYGRTA